MIIECTECQKQYYLEDTKITSHGVRVRCSQCNTVFMVKSIAPRDLPEHPREPAFPLEQHYDEADIPPAPSGQITHAKSDTRDRDISSIGPKESDIPDSAFVQEDEIAYAYARAFGADGYFPGASTPMPAEMKPSVPFAEPSGLEAEAEAHLEGTLSSLSTDSAEELAEPIKKQRKRSRRIWLILFGSIVSILGGGTIAGYYLFKGTFHVRDTADTLISKTTSILGISEGEKGSIKLSELNGYFVTRGKDNSIFVIEGKATNQYQSPCSFLQVNGVLFDENGAIAARQSAYCGNTLNLKELQTYSKKTILEKLENAYGSTLSNLNLDSDQSLPFMLVFFDPPPNISEYSVEVADFKKATPKTP